MTYIVKNWEKHFENNRSRSVDKLNWVPMPNHHDGNAYCELMDDENGIADYGCWALIVQVASKCQPRGSLLKSNGEPHTAESLARMVRVPIPAMRRAIEKLVKIGWLTADCQQGAAMCDSQPSHDCHPPVIERKKERREEKEEKEEKEPPPPQSQNCNSNEANKTHDVGETGGGGGELENKQQPDPALLNHIERIGIPRELFLEYWELNHVNALRSVACLDELGDKCQSPIGFFKVTFVDKSRLPSRIHRNKPCVRAWNKLNGVVRPDEQKRVDELKRRKNDDENCNASILKRLEQMKQQPELLERENENCKRLGLPPWDVSKLDARIAELRVKCG